MSALKNRLILTLLLASFVGCAVPQPRPSLENRNTAKELIDKGVVSLRQGDITGARAAFEAAAEIARIPEALDGLGVIAFLQGDIIVAEQLFNAAYDNGAYPHALGNLALLYESQGKLILSRDYYQRAVAEDPTNFRTRSNYAVFLAEHLSDIQKARDELLKAQVIKASPIGGHNQEYLSPKFNLD
jgi:Tfp pilus assembly protein PilF